MNLKLAKILKDDSHKIIHLLFIGTKPDIIKMAPIYQELHKRSELVVVCHTGQHYDFSNSKAILKELHMAVDVNLKIHGAIDDKLSQIIRQTGSLIRELKKPIRLLFHMYMATH